MTSKASCYAESPPSVFVPLAASPGLRILISACCIYFLYTFYGLTNQKSKYISLYSRIHNSLKNSLIHKVQILIHSINLKFFIWVYTKHKIKVQSQVFLKKYFVLWISANIVWFVQDSTFKLYQISPSLYKTDLVIRKLRILWNLENINRSLNLN